MQHSAPSQPRLGGPLGKISSARATGASTTQTLSKLSIEISQTQFTPNARPYSRPGTLPISGARDVC